MSSIYRDASRLVYKALQLSATTSNDAEYRELLAKYRADPMFSGAVQDVSIGMELSILDVSERGLIVAPASRESRFSLRLTDLRQQLNTEQRIALAMAHLSVAAIFFPTTDRLDDDARAPLPAAHARFRDTLLTLVTRLADAQPDSEDAQPAEELAPGWQLLKRLPAVNPKAERAAPSSVEGFVRIAVNRMVDYGLLRVFRAGEDEGQTLYTATHRLRIHLRELTLPRLFALTRNSARASEGL